MKNKQKIKGLEAELSIYKNALDNQKLYREQAVKEVSIMYEKQLAVQDTEMKRLWTIIHYLENRITNMESA